MSEGSVVSWSVSPEGDGRGRRGVGADSSRDPLTGEPFDRLQVLPEDGRRIYRKAFALAERQIRIEICVLEDPKTLAGLRDALDRGVRVRAIVDRGKYESLPPERQNLAADFVAAGGELQLSNPIFPRSFPKTILIDSKLLVYGSACLDSTTFAQYRDFALASTDPTVLRSIRRLFANDWAYSAPVGQEPPPFNPTPPLQPPELLIAPRNAAAGLSDLYQKAERRLDAYTEELGNAALESELVAAVARGVRVRLITPGQVNGFQCGAEPAAHRLDRGPRGRRGAGAHQWAHRELHRALHGCPRRPGGRPAGLRGIDQPLARLGDREPGDGPDRGRPHGGGAARPPVRPGLPAPHPGGLMLGLGSITIPPSFRLRCAFSLSGPVASAPSRLAWPLPPPSPPPGPSKTWCSSCP